MSSRSLTDIIEAQRLFFQSGRTLDIEGRIALLKKFRLEIVRREHCIHDALYADMKKPLFESYAAEVGFILNELRYTLKNIRRWTRPRRVPVPLSQILSFGRVYPEPRGTVLVMAPWNYPFQLVFSPLISALAAGNTVVLKPSERAPHASRVIAGLIADLFDPRHVCCIEGDGATSRELLGMQWDYIFFTGTNTTARDVMRAAAENLTPLTLQLGGKNPCIVDCTANLETTARRIVWGKFFNAGQTCVAPDYLVVDAGIKDRLLAHMTDCIRQFYGDDPSRSPDYARIIDKRNFDKLAGLLSLGRVVTGGTADPADRYIAPTILDDVDWDRLASSDEIFGPILPVVACTGLSGVIARLRNQPRPLALYLFSTDRAAQKRIIREVSCGGGCINDTVSHCIPPALPFGGIGGSGFGACHGKAGFDLFTHYKSILRRPFFFDLKLRYAPYAGNVPWLRRFFR